MSLCTLHRQFLQLNPVRFTKRCLSALPQADSSQWYRTDEHDPSKQTSLDLGKFYTVPPEVPKLFGKELSTQETFNANNYFAPRPWVDRCEVLKETAIMVREPALYIIDCIKQTDFSKPVNRYLLYGEHGCGKSLSLAHLTHFGHSQGMVVLSLSHIKKWLTKYYTTAPSTYRKGHIDHIKNSNILLKNFKQANTDRLADCVTHREYVWSVREKTPAGSPLMDIVDVGCERLPFSADALNVLLRELAINCSEGRARLMLVCDGVNSLFSDHTLVHREKTEREYEVRVEVSDEWTANCVKVDECSVLRNIKKLFSGTWNGGVVVGSLCKGSVVEKTATQTRWWRHLEASMRPDTTSHRPFQLLGEEGWRAAHPFMPVEVLPYSEAELDSHIAYYVERGWMGKECMDMTAKQEIHFLTGRNPKDFFNFSPSF